MGCLCAGLSGGYAGSSVTRLHRLRGFGPCARAHEVQVLAEHWQSPEQVDFLVDVCGQTKLWFPVELTRELSALLGRRVDVVVAQQLRESIRDEVLAEAVAL